jgi:4-aminobutyrate aminotransferase
MLFAVTPGKHEKRVFFSNSGSESVDTAIKCAKWHSRRPYGIGFLNGFHGRTMGAVSFTTTGLTARRGFAPLYPIGQLTPYPYCYRCMFGKRHPECGLACLDYLTDVLFKKVVAPDETAFIIVEPIQGAGGYIVPPPDFFPRLREVADKHGIILIVDEVQTGFARTGKMFASEHFGLVPDIMTLSKAIAHGLPCAATIARAELMDWYENAHEGTLNGSSDRHGGGEGGPAGHQRTRISWNERGCRGFTLKTECSNCRRILDHRRCARDRTHGRF